MSVRFFLALAATSAFTTSVNAYDVPAHATITQQAVEQSVLVLKPATLSRLGIVDRNAKWPSTDPDVASKLKTFPQLLSFGSMFEDERQIIQALYHFCNAKNGDALRLELRSGGSIVPGHSSPDWILGDKGSKVDLLGKQNPFSYTKSRSYFLDALTKSSKSDRDTDWGLTFQTLGHVIHHLQDMAQPQHTRNDPHCPEAFCAVAHLLVKGIYKERGYENYAQGSNLTFGAYDPVFQSSQTNGFKTPRQFFHTNQPGAQASGKGIAEFSNTNFVTTGTLFRMSNGVALPNASQPLPVPAGSQTISLKALYESINEPLPGSAARVSERNRKLHDHVLPHDGKGQFDGFSD
jgi:hypothetical protein